jgi:hypothetical protein
MSTNAYVGYEYEDGTVDYVYVHFDGYTSSTGSYLLNITDPEEALGVVLAGDQSVIGEPYADRPGEIWDNNKPVKLADRHEFAEQHNGYHRYVFSAKMGTWTVLEPGRVVWVGLRRAISFAST